MKVKYNSGFTLIELLVTLAIIAALAIAMGVGATNVLNSSYKKDYAETFRELFKNANIYVESTTYCNLDETKKCTVTIDTLVKAGLIDKNIYNKDNPYRKNSNFISTDRITITLANGKKKTAYKWGTCRELNNNNVDKYEYWGECK